MDKVTLVTGANRGIGLEVCRQLADEGYTVILGSRDLDRGEEAAQELPDTVIPKKLDVTNQKDVDALASWVESEYGRLDALVNNAAIDYDTDQNVLSADLERVRRAFDANTLGPWRLAQAFVPLLKKSEHPRLVNVSSGAGALDGMSGGTPAYSLSKAALNALTICLPTNSKATACWSTPSILAGRRPTWVEAEDRSLRVRRVWRGRSCLMTTVLAVGFSEMGGKYRGS